MAHSNTRQEKRAPVTLKIKFKSETLDQFIERYSVDISHGGIFIRTKDPLPVGTSLKFEFQLKDASPLILGDGTVVWTREHDPSRSGVAPGMGVRFDRLPPESQQILDRILAQKQARAQPASSEMEDDRDEGNSFVDTPTRVVPSPLVEGLARGTSEKSTGAPRPFESDADDFSDETFEEATKVASLDALVRKTADASPAAKNLIARRPSPSAPKPEVAAPAASGAQADEKDGVAEEGKADGDYVDPFADMSDDEDAADGREANAGAAVEEEIAGDRGDEEDFEDAPKAAAEPDTVAEPDTAAELDATDEGEPEAAEAAPEPAEEPAGKDRAVPEADEAAPDAEEDAAPSAAGALSETAAEPTREPAVARARDIAEDRAGSNLAWIAAAAALLLIVGVGGWWLWRTNGSQEEIAAAGASKEEAGKAGKATETRGEPEPAARVGGEAGPQAELVITSEPAGATAELLGEGRRGPTPMTFTGLDPERTYTVRLSHEGYLPHEVEVKPGEEAPESVELKPATRAIKIDSTPPGATIFVNGVRQGTTPATVELKGKLSEASSYAVELKRSGFQPFETAIAASDSFRPEGGVLVREVRAELERSTPAPRAPAPRTPRPKAESAAEEKPAKTGEGAKAKKPAGAAEEKPAKTDEGAKAKEPEKTKPASEPVPDFMKD